MCQTQATASDHPIYNIFVPQKVSLSKTSNDVLACDLWFAPLPIKNPGYNNVIRVRFEPRLCDQDRRKNDDFILSATLPIISPCDVTATLKVFYKS